MFESLVSSVLQKLLTNYVEGFNASSMQIAMWSGDVILRNLVLKKSALEVLDVPFSLRWGVIGELSLKIPWQSLGKSPVQVRVANVFIILEPRRLETWSAEQIESREQLAKQERLLKAEKIKSEKRAATTANAETPADPDADTFSTRLLASIIDNVQIEVYNIHLRYEDNRVPGQFFAAGITLESCRAISTNSKFEEVLARDSDKLIYKLVSLANLAVYWNTDTQPLNCATVADGIDAMDRLILRQGQPPPPSLEHSYMADPVCGSLKIQMRKSVMWDLAQPKVVLEFQFSKIALKLNERQWFQCITTSDWALGHDVRSKYYKYRPANRALETAAERWKFFCVASLSKVQSKRAQWSIEHIQTRRRNRLQYIKLYRQRLQTKQASSALDELERELDFDSIMYFRSLAEVGFEPEVTQNPGWLGWMLHSPGASTSQVAKEEVDISEAVGSFTNQEKKLFYSLIGYSEDESENQNITSAPREYVHTRASLQLEALSVTLVGYTRATLMPIVTMNASQFQLGVSMRKHKWTTINATLSELTIDDLLHEGSHFPRLVSVRDDTASHRSSLAAANEHFLSVGLELSPPPVHIHEKPVDTRVSMAMKGLDIIVSKSLIKRLSKFFSAPFKETEELDQVAIDQLENFRDVTVMQMQYLLDNHKVLDINIEAIAPRIIVLESLHTQDSLVLVADLGLLRLSSRLPQQSDPAVSSSSNLTAIDWHERLYDKYTLNMSNLQLQVARATDAWRSLVVDERRSILKPFNLEVRLDVLISDPTPTLPKIKASGNLVLDCHLTARKIQYLLRILDTISLKRDPSKEEIALLSEESRAMIEAVNLADANAHSYDVKGAKSTPTISSSSSSASSSSSSSASTSNVAPKAASASSKPNARIFQGQFSIAQLSLSFATEDTSSTGAPEDFLQLVSEELQVEAAVHPKDISAVVRLHTISLIDLRATRPEHRYLITTKDESNENGDLLWASFRSVAQDHPEYAQLDQRVDFTVSHARIIVNREPIVELVHLLDTGVSADDELREERKAQRMAKYLARIEERYNSLDTHDLASKPQPTPLPPASATTTTAPTSKSQAKVAEIKEPPKHMFLKLLGSMKSLTVVLVQRDTELAVAQASDFLLQLQMSDHVKKIRGSLGNVSLNDVTPTALYHKNIIFISGTHTVHFSFEQYSPNFTSYPGYGSLLRLGISSIKFAFANRFILDVADFFSEMVDMQKALSLASHKRNEINELNRQVAADEDKDPTTSLLRYEIMSNNIQVLLPENSESPQLLQFDFGQISVKNVHNEIILDSERLLQERIAICMSAANLQSGITGTDTPLIWGLEPIIEKVDMLMEVERMVLDPNHRLPALKIAGDIADIHWIMSEDQFGLFMNCIMHTLAEVDARPKRTPSSSAAEPTPSAAREQVDSVASLSSSEDSPLRSNDQVFVKMVMTYCLHSLRFTCKIPSAKSEGYENLASLVVDDFSFLMASSSNGSSEMDLAFKRFTLTDQQPDTNESYRKLMSHTCQGDNDESQFQMYLATTSNSKTKMSIKFTGTNITFVPSSVNGIRAFFTTPKVVPAPTVKRAEQRESNRDVVSLAVGTPKFDLDRVIAMEPDFAMSIAIVDTEVVFMSDPSAETRGIVMSTSFLMKLNTHKVTPTFTATQMGIFLDGMQMDSRIISKPKTAVKILKPLNFSFKAVMSPTKVKMDIVFDPMVFTVSYKDVALLQEIASKLTATPPGRETPPSTPSHSPSAASASASSSSSSASSSSSSLPPPPTSATAVHTVSNSAISKLPAEEELSVCTGGIRFRFIDVLGDATPLAFLRFSRLSARVTNWSSRLLVKAGFALHADYYNTHIAAWEPIIEPWSTSIVVRQFAGHGMGEMQTKGSTVVEVSSEVPLQINFSKIFYEKISASMAVVAHDEDEAKDKILPLFIQNDSGQSIKFWLDRDHCEIADAQREQIHGTAATEYFPDQVKYSGATAQTLSLQVSGGWDRLNGLPLNHVGTWLVPLLPKPTHYNIFMSYSVSFTKDYSKLVAVESNIHIVNATNATDMDVSVVIPRRPPVILAALPFEGTRALPVQYAYCSSLRFRPTGAEALDWSSFNDRVDLTKLSPGTTRTVCTQASRPSNNFYCNVVVTETETEILGSTGMGSRYTVTIHPIVVLENLLIRPLLYRLYRPGEAAPFAEGEVASGQELMVHEVRDEQGLDISIAIEGFAFSQRRNFGDLLSRWRTESLNVVDLLENGTNNRLSLSLLIPNRGQVPSRLSIFASYWIINMTPLTLQCQAIADKNTIGEMTARSNVPLIYSCPENDDRLTIKVAGGEWCKPTRVDAVGSVAEFQLEDAQFSYHLIANTRLGRGRFLRTKIVTISPKIQILNLLDIPLQCAQEECDAFKVEAGAERTLFWRRGPRELLRLSSSGDFHSSRVFSIAEISEFYVEIDDDRLAGVDIQLIANAFKVVLRPVDTSTPPYLVQNLTSRDLQITRKIGTRSLQEQIPAHGKYSIFPLPDEETTQVKLKIRNVIFPDLYNLAEARVYEDMILDGTVYGVSVAIEGPTKVLTVVDKNQYSIPQRDRVHAKSLKPTTDVSVQLAEVGVSLIDGEPKEILYLSVSDVAFSYGICEANLVQYKLSIGDMQLDNQLLAAKYPVAIARHTSHSMLANNELAQRDKSSSSMATENSVELEKRSFLVFYALQDSTFKSIAYWRKLNIKLCEIDVKLDDATVAAILEFANVNLANEDEQAFLEEFEPEHMAARASESSTAIRSTVSDNRKLFFDSLAIGQVSVNVSFSLTGQYSEDTSIVLKLLSGVGATVANIEMAPIRLPPLKKPHVAGTSAKVVGTLSSYYQRYLLRELYKLIGSFEILGNPVSLVRHLGTGIRDFASEPGLQGTTSLIKNSVVGISGSFGNFTNSIGTGASQLSCDADYIRKREQAKREQPKHLLDGIGKGAKEFGSSLLSGITGVIQQPANNSSFVAGVGKGLVGLAVKPAVGLVDFATRTAQGIQNTATYGDAKAQRKRPPRAFGLDRQLTHYSWERAAVQMILRTIDDRQFAKEWYQFHGTTVEGNLVIVSDRQMLLVNLKEKTIIWRLLLRDIERAEVLANKVSIWHVSSKISASSSGGASSLNSSTAASTSSSSAAPSRTITLDSADAADICRTIIAQQTS